MKKLGRIEMKNVTGGNFPPVYATVSCVGHVGEWQYTSMPSCATIAADVKKYCRSGEGTIAPGSQCTTGPAA